MRTIPVFVLSTLTLFAAACGDDGGSSGVPDSTKVGELTVDQSIALCHETQPRSPNT